MQKSKNITIAIITLILFYGLLVNFKVIKEINVLYILNPIVWIGLAILLRIFLGRTFEKKKLQKQIINYSIAAALVFIIVYMILGLFVTFGKNPYNTKLQGLIHNLWIFGSVIIAKEYVRYKLIENVYEKDKTKIVVLITVVFAIIEWDGFVGKTFTAIGIIKYIGEAILPSIAKNTFASYSARYSNYLPSIIYQLFTNLYLWLSPIIPNTPWIMNAIINTTIPIILFLYIRYAKNKLDILRNRSDIINSDPKNVIPLVIIVILCVWFATGILPIKPIAIASGSMEKELFVGDVAIVQKCNSNDVNVGDIIEYQMEGYTVIHRIIEKKQKNGTFYFITKGDNNNIPDKEEVKEGQLIGKVIFKIRYLGYPAIWLNQLQSDNQPNIKVELGN